MATTTVEEINKLRKRLVTRFKRMKHAEHWNQSWWARKTDCGTAFCVAGHALDLVGYKPLFEGSNMLASGFICPETGDEVDASFTARSLLGLADVWLFSDMRAAQDWVTTKDVAAGLEAYFAEHPPVVQD